MVFSLADPAHPARIWNDPSITSIYDIAIAGDRAYVATGPRIATIDLSDPAHPVKVGSGGSDVAGGLSVVEPFAFIAGSGYSLMAWDLTDPAEPAQVGSVMTANLIPGVAADSNLVLLASGPYGLKVYRWAHGLLQTLTFTPPALLPLGTATVPLQAAASSGGPVTFSVLSGNGTVEGNTLIFGGLGGVTVRASQAGDAQYLPEEEDRTVFVGGPPSIQVQPQPTNTASGQTVTLSVGADGPQPFSIRWYSSGSLVGSNLPTLSLKVTQTAGPGAYWVAVLNLAGVVTSQVVSVSASLPGSEFIFRPRGVATGIARGAGTRRPARSPCRSMHTRLRMAGL